MMRSQLISLSLLLACGSFLRAQDGPLIAPALGARAVTYGERDIVPVKAKVRFTTLIVLPKNEVILDFTCGDKEFWIVNGTANFAHVKPAKPKAETNLNLITASGNVYSFVLREISESANAEPDLKVFVEPKEESALAAINGQPRFVPFSQIDDYRQQAEIARSQARDAAEQAQVTIERELSRLRSEYPAKLRHAYRFAPADKLFRVSAMYHDGKFTYIRANPQETPALYEVKDGKPNLVEFDFNEGLYTVAKVLDSGYLAIGKKKLGFARTE
ncbi:MAG: TrbG/VirB9 family P-type conjugative transfer protein [Bryobacteraceae bacterium]|nr:TrbG/VirB9 family P-type conjugative transfer protein [Bryobacteraceae bacterium]